METLDVMVGRIDTKNGFYLVSLVYYHRTIAGEGFVLVNDFLQIAVEYFPLDNEATSVIMEASKHHNLELAA